MKAILDEGCDVPDGMQIGVDRAQDATRFYITEGGVVLVTAEMLLRAAGVAAPQARVVVVE